MTSGGIQGMWVLLFPLAFISYGVITYLIRNRALKQGAAARRWTWMGDALPRGNSGYCSQWVFETMESQQCIYWRHSRSRVLLLRLPVR